MLARHWSDVVVCGLVTSLAVSACGRGELGTGDDTSTGTTDTTSDSPTTQTPTTTVPTSNPTTGTTSPTNATDTSDTTTTTVATDTSTTTGQVEETTGTETETATETETGDVENDCCEAGDGPGCVDPVVEACVCANTPACCEVEWNSDCAALVTKIECGVCPEPPPPPGPCCEAGEGPSCVEEDVAACVCAVMPECCTEAWTDACVQAVAGLGCGQCGPNLEQCCNEQPNPGCNDPEIEACVCPMDPFCCDSEWDAICVENVDLFGCAMCPVPPGPCCETGGGAGCNDPELEACVCAAKPECCEDLWTAECAAAVEDLACAVCPSDCCMAKDTPSCRDDGVAACVCVDDPFCCEDEWDGLCVLEVELFGCGICS